MTTSHPLSHSHFYHQAHASSSSSNQEPPERIFVRARFDFQASDPSALNFKSGDVIEVITRLQSGWWDGMLGRRRGWFPSNYVEEVELDPGPEDSGDSGAEGEGDWGLEDLARELMGDAGLEGMVGGKDEEGRDFEAAAAERRRRLNKQDEGGGGGREREGTDQTVREPQPSGMSRLSEGSGRGRREEDGEEGDAWVPCLSPDGRVYYHNTKTFESAWEIPISNPSLEEEYYGPEDDLFNTFSSRPSSSAYGTSELRDEDVFRAPPKARGDIPHPWVARLRDDGREWYYYNRVTGESLRDFPAVQTTNVVDLGEDVKRFSTASSGYRPLRASVEVRRKAVDEWSSRLQDALRPTLKSPDNPTMGLLMENVQDALREVFEAAVAGAAAEEEMSRARDLGSEWGMAAAVLRDESAVEMLVSAHQAILEAIRDLLVGFGYVGPLDRMEEMPRPDWTGDMTLIGCVGLLSANTHAAVTSRRSSVIGQSVWQDVMRSASKLKDVVGTFPESVFPTTSAEAVERVEGRIRDAWLGIDGVGELMGGRWGFGKTEKPMRMLEQSSITEAQKLKAELHAAMRSIQDENFLDVLRIAAKYRDALVVIDVVSSIDLDGNDAGVVNGHRPETEDVRVYAELVAQARQTLQELDTARSQTDDESVLLLSGLASGNLGELCARLASSIASSFNSISDLLDIALEQVSIVNSGAVRGQIGIRSPRYMIARHSSARPPSMTSTQSRHSKRSDRESRRQRVRGLEEEFLDEEEERDRAGAMISAASDSQTSLAVSGQGQRAKDEVSAMSSTTSLAYQQMESDSGSNKGNRSSFMKFMRGRSSSEPDDGRGTERVKPSNRKLAKILGEDLQSLPSVPVPLAPPETPWYLGEDYEPGDIVFDDKGGVKAGTLKALVARLTPHGSTDTTFFQAFLLTFRSFTTGGELFDLLVERYHIESPRGMNTGEALDWKKLKQTPIRLRVSNTIRNWLDVHYVGVEDLPILPRVAEFARTTLLANGSELLSKQLLTLVQRRQQGEGDTQRRTTSGGMLSAPAPLLPRVPPGRDMRVTDINPLELARQMTILEFGYFQKIKPAECLNKAWNMEGGEQRAPNVRSVIHTANVLSGWVVVNVLSSKDVKTRANVMKCFIQTGLELRNLNNFSSMAAIAAGLNSAPVTRLKRTKEMLSQKTWALKADLDSTLDSTRNFSKYKDLLKTVNPPCVPFFGFWLSALTFIEDGNKDLVKPSIPLTNGMTPSVSSSSIASASLASVPPPRTTPTTGKPLINFFKRSLSAEILRDIQQYQFQPYNLARCKPVYDFIMRGLEATDKRKDDVYEISLQLEPREKEEEKITRMLHESGFI